MQASSDGVHARVSGPVEQARSLGVEEFFRDYYSVRGAKPVMFPGLLAASGATDRWSDENLKAKVGGEVIEVYVSLDGVFPGGRGPWDGDKHRMVEMPFREGLDRMAGDPRYSPIIAPGEKYYVYQSGASRYASLLAGLKIEDPVYLPPGFRGTRRVRKNFWFSAAGNLTPPHFDCSDNHLAQARGRKRVLLWGPDQADRLYINPMYEVHDRQSAVDVKNPDLQAHPRFEQAEALECFLEPGDVVFIPSGWIHCVVTLDFSISVSFMWGSRELGGFSATPEKTLVLQYLLGLYPLRPELREVVRYHLAEGVARRADRVRSLLRLRPRSAAR